MPPHRQDRSSYSFVESLLDPIFANVRNSRRRRRRDRLHRLTLGYSDDASFFVTIANPIDLVLSSFGVTVDGE